MLKVDLHIHSINSGHAYSTFQDIVDEAVRKDMSMVAVTDHGPSMDGTNGPVHFYMGNRAPKKIKNTRILWGIEANLIDSDGTIDLPEDAEKRLDLIILGIHPFTPYMDLGRKGNTNALIKAIERYPRISILAHPLHYFYEYEFEPVWEAALAHNILLEFNLSYLVKYGERDIEKFQMLVEFVRKHGSQFIINSDAHFRHEIGDDSILDSFRDTITLDGSLVINNDENKLRNWLGIE